MFYSNPKHLNSTGKEICHPPEQSSCVQDAKLSKQPETYLILCLEKIKIGMDF